VAGALPGGDPLAAALAAGETPSPQMVAASGETSGPRPRVAVACLASVIVALGLVVFLGIHYSGLEKMRLELTPEVLTQKAREIIARLGYSERPIDSATGLDYDNDLKDSVEKNEKPHPNWEAVLAGRPSLLRFWYRQSPDHMMAEGFQDQLLNPGIVGRDDPPTILSGMINLELDPQGQLTFFQAIPPQKESTGAQGPAFDWNVLFAAAGLDQTKLQKAEPHWNSLAAADTRMAWTGMWPGNSRALRVEAASWHGKPVFFSLIGDWTKANRMKNPEDSAGKRETQVVTLALILALLLGATYLARRNLRQGRGDREGAFRLASLMFAMEMLLWLCRGHLVPGLETLGLFVIAVSTGLFVSGTTWVLYLALEPWVRRRWPQAIISWSRLLSGQFRDPLVGRDILLGVMLGVLWILIFQIRAIPMFQMGSSPGLASTEYLIGGRTALGIWLMQIPVSILGTLQFFFLLLGLKVVMRKDWLATMAFIAIFALPRGLTSSYPTVEVPTQILVYAIAVLIVYRFGLVPLACAIFTVNMMANLPFTADLSAWYMPASGLAVLSVAALAGWGFYQSLGGEPIWRPEIG
jgi:serine/threonine-protein kinase